MTKCKKVIIALSIIVILIGIILGILFWGFQPISETEINYKTLVRKVNNKYLIPHKLPYDNSKCLIYSPYWKANRFNNIFNYDGYRIECYSKNIKIVIAKPSLPIVLDYTADYIEDTYNNIRYLYTTYIKCDTFLLDIAIYEGEIIEYYISYYTILDFNKNQIISDIELILDSFY